MNKVDGLFVVPFGPLILKTASPLDPRSLIARRNPALIKIMAYRLVGTLAIVLTNAGILLIGPLGINFSEIFIEIPTFPSKKMRLKVSSANWRPFCLGLHVLNAWRSSSNPYTYWIDIRNVNALAPDKHNCY